MAFSPIPLSLLPTCDSLPVNQKAANTILVFVITHLFSRLSALCVSASHSAFPRVELAGSSSMRRFCTAETRAPRQHQLCCFSGNNYS